MDFERETLLLGVCRAEAKERRNTLRLTAILMPRSYIQWPLISTIHHSPVDLCVVISRVAKPLVDRLLCANQAIGLTQI